MTSADKLREAKRVLVCGSREWNDYAVIARRLDELPRDCIVIHGGARGADQRTGEIAKARGLHVAIVYALWESYGKAAGHKRNAAMVNWLCPDLVIAFSLGTPGTQSTIDLARAAGIPVEVVGRELAEQEPTPSGRRASRTTTGSAFPTWTT